MREKEGLNSEIKDLRNVLMRFIKTIENPIISEKKQENGKILEEVNEKLEELLKNLKNQKEKANEREKKYLERRNFLIKERIEMIYDKEIIKAKKSGDNEKAKRLRDKKKQMMEVLSD